LPARDGAGRWIVKLPDAEHREVPINEYATMELARSVGLDVPECRLVARDEIDGIGALPWPAGEAFAFAVERFDRSPSGRVHIEDLAQVKGIYASDKYTSNYETLLNLVYRRHDDASLVEAVRRLAFCVAIRNGDAHWKNWSLRYADGRVPRLSPAYDLVSTECYAPPGTSDGMALTLGGRRRFDDLTLESFRSLARRR
jgi:serine/threonine-protein kinase HipA